MINMPTIKTIKAPKPTKKYDRIWASVCSDENSGLKYTEVLWSSNFGSAFVTMTKELYSDFEKSKEKYLSEFIKKNEIIFAKFEP